MELVVVLLVVGVVAAFVAGVAVTRRRARPELGPPPAAAPPEVEAPPEVVEGSAEVVEAPPEPEVEVVPEAPPEPQVEVVPEAPPEPEVVAPPERPRLRDRLDKARSLLAGYVSSVLARTTIEDATWDDLEEALVRADVGAGLSAALLDDLRTRVKAENITEPAALLEALKQELKARLAEGDRTLAFEPGATNVWLFVGVNGTGKTTSIGKIGRRAIGDGHTVVMAAADTFRAAAAEQLGMWADRVGAELVRGAEGADPSSVVFDAVQRAHARGSELVLGDTAGRLHTKVNLMEELKKIRRIAERDPGRLNEVLLVIDATTGQNGLVQAREFTEAAGVTGIVLTKLDGTAKGGIALAIKTELGLPIKLVGVGETAEALVDFDPDEFVEALFE